MEKYRLLCRDCNNVWNAEAGCYRCPDCGGVLNAAFSTAYLSQDERLTKAVLQSVRFWDFKDMLPVSSDVKIITLGEGDTPTALAENLAQKMGLRRIYIKNETMNPTGTFKDRCMAVALTKAVELKAPAVVLGSAGNAASAAAAYAAKACIPCYVLVPETTPIERIAQTLLYGAKMVLVKGTVNDCIDLISQLCAKRGWHNVTTACTYNPYQAEAPKTIAYEMAKALGGDVPDWVLVPVGGGGILSAIWKGFCELKADGFVKKLPRMVGTQADGCAAVVKTFKEGKQPHEMVSWGKPSTIAAAIADPYPLDGEAALTAIYQSGGCAEDVTDTQILDAQKLLACSEGIFAEPASSTTIAALNKLIKSGFIQPGDTAACVITGTGMKDPRLAASNVKQPPIIENSSAALEEALEKLGY